MLIPPSLEEVKLQASKIDPPLPAAQAVQFFNYYQSNGWKVGKNRMRCWKSALSGWNSRYQERMEERGRPKDIPLGVQVRAIEKVLETHRGNPDKSWVGACTAAQREEYRALKKKLQALYRQIANL